MAVLHRAEIRPPKSELIAGWLPGRPWYAGPTHPDLVLLGSYRFDDPQGEVGIETHLVRVGDGPVLQVPLTYRAAPLEGAERRLVGTMEHSVLGRRWAYDACGDPVYLTALAATVLGGGREAEQFFDDGERRASTAAVQGSGAPGDDLPVVGGAAEVACSTDGVRTVVAAAGLELTILRVVEPTAAAAPGEHTLTGTWPGQVEPLLLATVRRS